MFRKKTWSISIDQKVMLVEHKHNIDWRVEPGLIRLGQSPAFSPPFGLTQWEGNIQPNFASSYLKKY